MSRNVHAHIFALALDMGCQSSINLDDRERLTDLGPSSGNGEYHRADAGGDRGSNGNQRGTCATFDAKTCVRNRSLPQC